MDNKQDDSGLVIEPSGYIRELSREEFVSRMQEYDVVGFRVVLREGK